MALRKLLLTLLALAAMGAAPLGSPAAGRPSLWHRMVEGTRDFARNPLGRKSQGAGPRLRQPAPLATNGSRRVSHFLPETIAGDRPPPRTAERGVRRAAWSSPERPGRTVSQYMAEEKP